MKVAVFADIHGNLPALQAATQHIAAWQPDVVVVAGDMVNRGPRPAECLSFVLEQQRRAGWRVLRGNHEEYVIKVARDPSDEPGVGGAVRQNVRWTFQQIPDAIPILEALPDQVNLTAPDGTELRIVHASMRHNRDNILIDTPDDVLREQIAPAPPVLVVGHTHRPLIRRIDDTLVVNVGSAGLPFDGDPCPSYGQLTWRDGAWQAQIVRFSYDRAQTKRDYTDSGFLPQSGPVGLLIFDEFLTANPRIFRWYQRYEAPVLAGEITVEAAVHEYLAMGAP